MKRKNKSVEYVNKLKRKRKSLENVSKQKQKRKNLGNVKQQKNLDVFGFQKCNQRGTILHLCCLP